MKRRYFFWAGLLVTGIIGVATLDATPKKKTTDSSDAAYTGATNSVSHPDAPAPAPKKKKKVAVPASSAAATTNAPSAAETNKVIEPASTAAASTNAPSVAETNSAVVPVTAAVASTNAAPTMTAPPAPSVHVSTLSTADLKEFADQTPAIQGLITKGLALTKLNLKYQYGSDDPSKGGMDCSGTVHYLLEQVGLKDVPRDASEIYSWAWKEGHIQPVTSSSLKTFELDRLKPGDLLFWTGTYDVQRDPPITHVMIYLGTNRQDGKRVMVGASEGRTYKGKSQYGVSVFDFVLPRTATKSEVGSSSPRESTSRFIGYGPVPGL